MKKNRGVALLVVIVMISILSLLAGYMLTLTYNQRKLGLGISGNNLKAYYRAQAGVVDAQWRLRSQYTGDIGGGGFPATAFTYDIDLDSNTVHIENAANPTTANDDVRVTIAAADGNGLRQITATGFDT